MKLQLTIIFFLLFSISAYSQLDRVYETDVQEEGKFLDALQLRILEKWPEAKDAFLELYRSDPTNDVICYELSRIYWKEKDNVNAINYARLAIESNPDKTIYREFLIDLLTEEKDFAALNKELREYIDEGKFDENYYYRLARSYENLGKFKDAIKVLNDLEDKTNYSERLGRAKVRVYQKERNVKKLSKELDRLTENYPGKINLLLHKAVLLHSMRQEKKAYQTYKEILSYDPGHSQANVFVSNYESSQEKQGGFYSSMERLMMNQNITIDEKIKQLIPYVPRVEEQSEMADDMLKLVELLQDQYPNDAKVNALHGDIYFNSGDLENAADKYALTISENKKVFLVWKQYMLSLDNLGRFDELKVTALEAIDYYPNQAVCFYYAGKANVETGNMNEGVEWLQEGIWMTSRNSKLKAEFELMLSFAALVSGDVNKATKHFNNVNIDALGINHSFYFEIKGDILNVQDKKAEALEFWQKSLLFGGRKDRLEEKIEKVKVK